MAFNVDIEMGISPDDPKKYRFYCATMTNVWHIDRSASEFDAFVSKMMAERGLDKSVPLPKKPDRNDLDRVESYMARLGCTPGPLRWVGFHEFIGIPDELRSGGLKYVKHRRFGKQSKAGLLQVPPRFVQKKPSERYVILYKEGRANYIAIYTKSGETHPMSFFKVTSGTRFTKVDAIPNSFAFQVGKRQWVFIAAGAKDFKLWTRACISMLKEQGVKVTGFEDEEKGRGISKHMRQASKAIKSVAPLHSKNTQAEDESKQRKKYEEDKEENTRVRKAIVDKNREMAELSREIEKWQKKKAAVKSNEDEERRKKEEELRQEMARVDDEHGDRMEKLRKYLENLHRKIEEKARKDGFLKVGALFTDDGYQDGDVQVSETGPDGNPIEEEEQKGVEDDDDSSTPKDVGIDADGNVIDVQPEETDGNITDFVYTYRNSHKHDHVHYLLHKHVHYHDDTVEEDVVYTQTQTLAHSIVHTQTQFQIKKSAIRG